jgi:hypothetical protein
MKIKAITNASFREEFEVNTIAYHEDTNTWWVIKSDESTYLHTGEYEHEISLVEFLEFFAYRHLANCAFAPNTYTLDQMLKRIFRIGHVIDVRTKKSKLQEYDAKDAFQLNFYYQYGFNKYDEFASIFIEEGVIKQAGAWFSFADENGVEVKLNGKSKVIAHLKENESHFQNLLNMIGR